MLYKRIYCFLEVSRCLSFTAAAENLYMTQQAVTKQIAALEQDLGITLFVRSTRSVALTPAGQSLRDDFSGLHRQITESVRKAKQIAAGKRASISIGFPAVLSKRHIAIPVMELLFERFPDIYFEVRMLGLTELRNEMLDGKLDLCVTTSNDYNLWPNIKVDVLVSRPYEIVCSKNHPLAGEPFSMEALKKYTHLILPKDTLFPGGKVWAEKLPGKTVQLCPDIETLCLLLEAGRGFALLIRMFEGYDSDTLRYWGEPFPGACADLVCIRPAQSSRDVHPIVTCIRENFSL